MGVVVVEVVVVEVVGGVKGLVEDDGKELVEDGGEGSAGDSGEESVEVVERQ